MSFQLLSDAQQFNQAQIAQNYIDLTSNSGLTKDNLEAHQNHEKVFRFFGCISCKRNFWAKCWKHKPVAKCKFCCDDIKYDAIPKEDEFGHGKFKCSKCEHEWTNAKCTWQVKQPCLECGNEESPFEIGKPVENSIRKSRNKHHCELCDDKTGLCSRPRPNFIPSQVHESTGSTISVLSDSSFRGNSRGGRGGRRGRGGARGGFKQQQHFNNDLNQVQELFENMQLQDNNVPQQQKQQQFRRGNRRGGNRGGRGGHSAPPQQYQHSQLHQFSSLNDSYQFANNMNGTPPSSPIKATPTRGGRGGRGGNQAPIYMRGRRITRFTEV